MTETSNKLGTAEIDTNSTPDLVGGTARGISSGGRVRCVPGVLLIWETKLCADDCGRNPLESC